jgi:hypothetical protein
VIHLFDYLLFATLFILFAPWGMREAREWQHNFEQWLQEEKEYLHAKRELSDRLAEWRVVAGAIDRGQHPYHNLSNDLTKKIGKYAHLQIIHIQNELTRLEQQYHDRR